MISDVLVLVSDLVVSFRVVLWVTCVVFIGVSVPEAELTRCE